MFNELNRGEIMSKHTPGPWLIERTASGRFIRSIGPLSAEEYAGASWLEVSESDAHLIAAAPDLLAALKLAATMKEPEDKIERMIWNGHQQIIREVIAKAEGVK
jgi:hypothetical protein